MSIIPYPLSIIRLTPPGRGAVASLLLHGDNALKVFQKHFSKNIEPDKFKHCFGTFQLNRLNRCEQIVVHCPNRNEVEIHCHGGELIVTEIEAALILGGATPVSWQDFFCGNAAHKNIQQSAQRNTALKLLPFAPTERTAQILLDQYNGALERELSVIHSLQDETEKHRRLKRLQENAQTGKHLVEPFRVVLAGASNAGKSSLLNSLAGFHRSIVHQTAGTTRDVVSVQTAIGGFPVEFSDTAGFRTTEHEPDFLNPVDLIEQEGIRRSKKMLAESDLIIWVIDAALELPSRMLPPEIFVQKTLLCFNKMDLLSEPLDISAGISVAKIAVSAGTGEGIGTLLDTVIRHLVPYPPEPLEAVPLASMQKNGTFFCGRENSVV